MKLAFYYHSTVCEKHGVLTTAGYLGCFLDALAGHVEELVMVMHESSTDDPEMDYPISSGNISWINLGVKPHPLKRFLWGNRILEEKVKHQLDSYDHVLLRIPSPMLGGWYKFCKNHDLDWVPLVVGDMKQANQSLSITSPKSLLVFLLNHFQDFVERRILQGRKILVNSPALLAKYLTKNHEVLEVRTTTLSEASFFRREDTCKNEDIKLLYTGRFEWSKGLQELFDAFCKISVEISGRFSLHFVGWQGSSGPSIEAELTRQAREAGLTDRVIFHGRKTVGPGLSAMYQMADIYVLPSHAEGFPRTIWEAMAASLPVIATAVGGIPKILTQRKHALLVKPRSSEALGEAILQMHEDRELRKKLMQNAYELAKENTLANQTLQMVTFLKGGGDVA